MPFGIFARRESGQPGPPADPAVSVARARARLGEAAASADVSSAIPLLDEAIGAVRLAGPRREALVLLAGSYLIASRLFRGGPMPTDPELRFAGLCAVAIAELRGARGEAPPSETEEMVETAFRVLRGRLRGSVMVPRDVEYAFAGNVAPLSSVALGPEGRLVVSRLLEDGSRLEGIGPWPADARELARRLAEVL